MTGPRDERPAKDTRPAGTSGHAPDARSRQPPVAKALEAPKVRLFFALWPDAATLRALTDWCAQAHAVWGGRVMRPDTLHLTLAFLGQVPADLVDPLIRLTVERPFTPGLLRLDRYGVFPRQGIVWAGPGDGAPALAEQVAGLWRDLAALGNLRPDHPFRAHVTLLRNVAIKGDNAAGKGDIAPGESDKTAGKATPLPSAPPPLDWHYDRCVLVQSVQDGQSRYEVKATSR